MLQSRISSVFLAIMLAGCASQSSDIGRTGQTGGGITECTTVAVQPFVTAHVESSDPNNQMPISDLQCADGWAVAAGILGPKDAPGGGPQGAPTSIVLEAEGQFWIVKDKADVCGTVDPNAPESRPDNALIPTALYESACLAG